MIPAGSPSNIWFSKSVPEAEWHHEATEPVLLAVNNPLLGGHARQMRAAVAETASPNVLRARERSLLDMGRRDVGWSAVAEVGIDQVAHEAERLVGIRRAVPVDGSVGHVDHDLH